MTYDALVSLTCTACETEYWRPADLTSGRVAAELQALTEAPVRPAGRAPEGERRG